MKANDLVTRVATQIIEAIEAGAERWQMPWNASCCRHVSATGRPYRGVNAFILTNTAAAHEWETGVWATYNAWKAAGGQVRRGEKATHVFLWKPWEREDDSGETVTKRGVTLRTFALFAAEQVDGSEETVHRHGRNPATTGDTQPAIDTLKAAGANITHTGNRAYYTPTTDQIVMPPRHAFNDDYTYTSTLAHEHIHWTGAATRLNRDLTGRFGSNAYALEELCAELGAALYCAEFGLASTADRTQDHAAYISAWLETLNQHPRTILHITSKAQQAVDYILQAAETTNHTNITAA